MADTEDTPTFVNVDTLAAARGTAWRAAGELAGVLPDSDLRTALVGVFNKTAEVLDRLMGHANTLGVGELDVDELPDIEDLLDDGKPDEGPVWPAPVKVAFQDAEAEAAAGEDGPTAAQLKDRAKELGITGVSKLNKDDLAARVAEAEAAAGED